MNIFTQNFSHLIGGSGRGFCLFVSMKRGKMMTLHSKYWRMKLWTQFQVSILIYYQVCDRHIELDHLVNGHVDYFFIESINQMWKKLDWYLEGNATQKAFLAGRNPVHSASLTLFCGCSSVFSGFLYYSSLENCPI